MVRFIQLRPHEILDTDGTGSILRRVEKHLAGERMRAQRERVQRRAVLSPSSQRLGDVVVRAAAPAVLINVEDCLEDALSLEAGGISAVDVPLHEADDLFLGGIVHALDLGECVPGDSSDAGAARDIGDVVLVRLAT